MIEYMNRTQPHLERAVDLQGDNTSQWVTDEAAALLGEQYSSSRQNRLKQLADHAKTALEQQPPGSTDIVMLETAARAALKASGPSSLLLQCLGHRCVLQHVFKLWLHS